METQEQDKKKIPVFKVAQQILIYLILYISLVFSYDPHYGNGLLWDFITWTFVGYLNLSFFLHFLKEFKPAKAIGYIVACIAGLLTVGFFVVSYYVVFLFAYIGVIIAFLVVLKLLSYLEIRIQVGLMALALVVPAILFFAAYPGFCEKNDGRCLANRAMNLGGTDFCRHGADDGDFNGCISQIASKKKDINVCNDIILKESEKYGKYYNSEDACYYAVVRGSSYGMSEDREIMKEACEKMSKIDPERHTSCITDAEKCEEITYGTTYVDSCLFMAATWAHLKGDENTRKDACGRMSSERASRDSYYGGEVVCP